MRRNKTGTSFCGRMLFHYGFSVIIAKCLLLAILFIITQTSQGQNGNNLLKRQPGIYTYNNEKDTIYLSTVLPGMFGHCDTIRIIDSIQIDGKGAKEFVFYRHCSGHVSEHGGTFDIDESAQVSKYEIWNLDTKTLLFEAINRYKLTYNRFGFRKITKYPKGTESWSYDFSIDSMGTITIGKLKTYGKGIAYGYKTTTKKGKPVDTVTEIPHTYIVNADHQQGVYKYIDGKYVQQ